MSAQLRCCQPSCSQLQLAGRIQVSESGMSGCCHGWTSLRMQWGLFLDPGFTEKIQNPRNKRVGIAQITCGLHWFRTSTGQFCGSTLSWTTPPIWPVLASSTPSMPRTGLSEEEMIHVLRRQVKSHRLKKILIHLHRYTCIPHSSPITLQPDTANE